MPRSAACPFLLTASLLAACSSTGTPIPDGWEGSGDTGRDHVGPAVDGAPTGTARFAPALLDAFDTRAAMEVAEYADGFYREPANDGYEATIDRLLADLYGVGFGSEAGFELEVLETGMPRPAWTPLSASVELVRVGEGGRGTQSMGLLRFADADDEARVMLPADAPPCDVTAPIATSLEELEPGMILLTERSIRSVEQEAADAGAAGVLSSFLFPYTVDPTGEERHRDAIFYGSARPGTELPGLYVSPRVAETIGKSAAVGGHVRMRADVRFDVRRLRTVVATIVGDGRPDEAVYVVAHVDAAGANDNAAGVGGILQCALVTKALVESGRLDRPRRSLSFVFGQEARAGGVVQDEIDRVPVAGIVADMIGADRERTGAICLLERGWDPGALTPLPPDEHTPWGAGDVVADDLYPNGLSIVVREALADVRAASGEAWETREHPWEGGSDHDNFLADGVAACLVWHFTDFAYHTSLDRMDHVDPQELRRSAVAVGSAALAVADGRVGDLERHLDSLNIERQLRLDAVVAADAGDELLEHWKWWFDGARHWLMAVCHGEPLPEWE